MSKLMTLDELLQDERKRVLAAQAKKNYLQRISNTSSQAAPTAGADVLHYTPNQVTEQRPAGADRVTAVAAGDDRRYKERV